MFFNSKSDFASSETHLIWRLVNELSSTLSQKRLETIKTDIWTPTINWGRFCCSSFLGQAGEFPQIIGETFFVKSSFPVFSKINLASCSRYTLSSYSAVTVLLFPTNLLLPKFPLLVSGISVSSASPHLSSLEAFLGSPLSFITTLMSNYVLGRPPTSTFSILMLLT